MTIPITVTSVDRDCCFAVSVVAWDWEGAARTAAD